MSGKTKAEMLHEARVREFGEAEAERLRSIDERLDEYALPPATEPASAITPLTTRGKYIVLKMQAAKCLLGEHEADESRRLLPTITVLPGEFAEVCKHCRCLFVEKG